MPEFLARELPFERYVVVAGERRFHVMEAGTGPPVVFLHGNPTWGYLWRNVARPLAGAGVRLVMPDLVGLGLSEKPRDPAFHTLDRHARLVGLLLDAIAPGPLVLVVHDWGGPIGLAALAARPGRLAGLVVTNTRLGPPRAGTRGSRFHRFASLPIVAGLAFRLLGFPQNALHLTQADRGSMRGAVGRAYRWPLRRIADRVAPLALARMVPIRGDDPSHPSLPGLRSSLAVAASFAGPAAVVWGERDPILGRSLHALETALPRARVTRVAAGHYPQEETPGAVAQAVSDVVARAGLA